jgi:hypothetical protein
VWGRAAKAGLTAHIRRVAQVENLGRQSRQEAAHSTMY